MPFDANDDKADSPAAIPAKAASFQASPEPKSTMPLAATTKPERAAWAKVFTARSIRSLKNRFISAFRF